MTASVTAARWEAALAAEDDYWSAVAGDAREFARILGEKVDAAEWFESSCESGLPAGDWVEIGIGPYGMGCIHFLSGAADNGLVGVEPLPQLPTERLELPRPLLAVAHACHGLSYRQVEAAGEATGLKAGRFGLACCYNVLDQVRDPAAVLREAHRILRPGGRLLLGCNTTSLLSRARHAIYGKAMQRRSLGLTAHTFRFAPGDVLGLVLEAGFVIRHTRLPQHALRASLVGRSTRILLAAEKPAGGSR